MILYDPGSIPVTPTAQQDQNIPQPKASSDQNVPQYQKATFEVAKRFMEAIVFMKTP